MKDVDLTSREWCDLIFEGKNKDFGAYEMRTSSVKRHNFAVLYTLLGAAIILGIVFAMKAIFPENEGTSQTNIEQLDINMNSMNNEEEEEEEQIIEEQKQQEIEEEKIETQQVTEIVAKKDEEVTKPPQTVAEIQENKAEIGNVTQEGHDRGLDVAAVVAEVEKKVEIKEEPKKPEPEKVFTSVEQMPSFPGGDAALMKYLSSHINYPPMAIENGIEGKVVVQFVVTKNGSVGEVKVVRSVNPDLDREAVRVCKSLPKFQPGKQNGQAVNVWYTLPVQFKLQH